jgi:hypothetical protein
VSETDQQYFARRAEEERAAATKASHRAAAASHLELAARYEDLANAIGGAERRIIDIRPLMSAA